MKLSRAEIQSLNREIQNVETLLKALNEVNQRIQKLVDKLKIPIPSDREYDEVLSGVKS